MHLFTWNYTLTISDDFECICFVSDIELKQIDIYYCYDDVSAESCEPRGSAWFTAADCWQFMSWFSQSSAAYVFSISLTRCNNIWSL